MADASNILAGSVEVANAFNLLGTFAVGVELRMFEAKTGITSTLALRHALPIQTGMRVWFNPGFTSNYLNFLAVGICTIPIQLGGFLISIRSGSSEYEEDEKEHLSRMTRNPWAIIAGKVLAYVAIIFPVSMAVLYTPHVFCGTPMMGSSLILALMTLWFTSLLVTVGFGLSCLFADPLFATEVCALVTLPNFLLSGFTWPVFAMSKVLWVLAYGMPLFSFSFLFRKISLMGAPAADGLPQMGILGIWTCIALVLARLGVHKMMKAGNPGEISHA
jgi:ABC-2 type transport system permease protein